VAVAVGEVLQVGRALAAGVHQRERLLDVVGVHQGMDWLGLKLLEGPAQRLLPGRVQERETAVHRYRREQVARHLEQARDPRVILARVLVARPTFPELLGSLVREAPESL
jgi:hypothetical protein